MTCTYTISKSFVASPLDRQTALSSLIIQLQGLYTRPVYFLRSTLSKQEALTDSKAVANRLFTPLFTLETFHSLPLSSAAPHKTPLWSQNVQPLTLKSAAGQPKVTYSKDPHLSNTIAKSQFNVMCQTTWEIVRIVYDALYEISAGTVCSQSCRQQRCVSRPTFVAAEQGSSIEGRQNRSASFRIRC